MKQFLQKLAFFVCLLLVIKITFVVFYNDKFEAEAVEERQNLEIDDPTERELQYRKFEVSKQNYDTIFIGSSRSSYGIIPPYFDALNGGRTKSYNFGINSGLPPQTFDWCEELIRTKSSIKYIFFELSGGYGQKAANDDFRFNLTFSEQLKKAEDYYSSRLLPFFKPRFPRKNLESTHRKTIYKKFYDDYNIPLEQVFVMKNYLPNEPVPEVVNQADRARNLRVEQKKSRHLYSRQVDYWNRISRLIELAESRQIRLYFYVPARLKNNQELEKIHSIYDKLDARHKLTVTHYHESLYRAETSYDYYHLSHSGAIEFTKLLAAAFDEQNF